MGSDHFLRAPGGSCPGPHPAASFLLILPSFPEEILGSPLVPSTLWSLTSWEAWGRAHAGQEGKHVGRGLGPHRSQRPGGSRTDSGSSHQGRRPGGLPLVVRYRNGTPLPAPCLWRNMSPVQIDSSQSTQLKSNNTPPREVVLVPVPQTHGPDGVTVM